MSALCKAFFASRPISFAGLLTPCTLGSRNKTSRNTISKVLRESIILHPRMYFTLIINPRKSFTREKLVEWQKWALGYSLLRPTLKSHGVRGSPLSAYCSILSRTAFPAAFKSVSPRHLSLAKVMYRSDVNKKTLVAGRTTGVTVSTRPRWKQADRHISFSGVNTTYLLHKRWWDGDGNEKAKRLYLVSLYSTYRLWFTMTGRA